MIADNLYDRIKDSTNRLTTRSLKHVFDMHAWELKKGLTKRFTASTAMIEADWSHQCAAMLREIGHEKIGLLREYMPLELPARLEQVEIGKFRKNLERILTWHKNDGSPAAGPA